jgi:hypothetical protein
LLERAGYESIACEPVDRELDLAAGGGVDAAIEFVLGTGPVARAIAEANLRDLGPIAASLRRALSAHARNQRVPLGSSSWIVTADRPRVRSA